MSEAREKVMRVGAAEVVITPPLGTELAGYFSPRVSEGIISDLKAKAVVAGTGENRIALVACDLLTMTAEVTARARERIAREIGIAPARVMVCATHTHTGPDLRKNRIVKRNEEWYAALPEKIAAAVAAADRQARDAIPTVGVEPEEGLAFNRRFRYRDGTEQFGVRSPGEVVGPAGPTDPEFGVLAFRAGITEPPFAVICNYTLHIDVTGGNLISADFPAVLTEVLRSQYGPETIVLYVQGACGNINHVPYQLERPWPVKGVWKSQQIGRTLAGKAMAAIEKGLPCESRDVDAEQEILQVPKYPLDDVLEERLRQARAAQTPNFFEKHLLETAESYDPSGTVPREVQTLRFGDAVFCGAPGEYFVEWGLEIKKWSPHPYTFIAELANDSAGYIPTFEAFRRGGYEATPVVSVTSTPALGQMIADANFRLNQRLWQRRNKTTGNPVNP